MKKITHPVFVILPLQSNAHVRRVFTQGIKPALADYGFEARRVDDQAVKGGIIDAIRKEIKDAYFIIADLSFARPNCYYELGYAQAIGKPVLLLKEEGTPLHFDIAHQQVHSFGNGNVVKKLVAELVPDFLKTEKRVSGDNRNHKFGQKCINGDFRLAAEIAKCTKSECFLNVEVSSINPNSKLEGAVRFFMHKSYRKLSKLTQPMTARNGIVRKPGVESSDGPWTLGAELVNSGIRLELDLATIPGAKKWWYKRAYDLA